MLCNCRRLPLSGFSVHRTDRTGLAARCGRSFFLSAKDTFQRPPATRWTGIFQISFALVIRATGFLQPAGREFFLSLPTTPAYPSWTGKLEFFALFSTTDKNQKCQTPGQKNFPFTYYYNPNRAKWPGTEPGNKKSSKSFSRLTAFAGRAGGGWYSVFMACPAVRQAGT